MSEKHASEDGKLEDDRVESASFASFVIDPEEERRLVRKLDNRILPITCLLYLFACELFILSCPMLRLKCARWIDLDRSNLGNARLQGLPKDTLGGDPTGKRFDWVNSIFFFAYVRRGLLPAPTHSR
jgi:hypothetical protein